MQGPFKREILSQIKRRPARAEVVAHICHRSARRGRDEKPWNRQTRGRRPGPAGDAGAPGLGSPARPGPPRPPGDVRDTTLAHAALGNVFSSRRSFEITLTSGAPASAAPSTASVPAAANTEASEVAGGLPPRPQRRPRPLRPAREPRLLRVPADLPPLPPCSRLPTAVSGTPPAAGTRPPLTDPPARRGGRP